MLEWWLLVAAPLRDLLRCVAVLLCCVRAVSFHCAMCRESSFIPFGCVWGATITRSIHCCVFTIHLSSRASSYSSSRLTPPLPPFPSSASESGWER